MTVFYQINVTLFSISDFFQNLKKSYRPLKLWSVCLYFQLFCRKEVQPLVFKGMFHFATAETFRLIVHVSWWDRLPQEWQHTSPGVPLIAIKIWDMKEEMVENTEEINRTQCTMLPYVLFRKHTNPIVHNLEWNEPSPPHPTPPKNKK